MESRAMLAELQTRAWQSGVHSGLLVAHTHVRRLDIEIVTELCQLAEGDVETRLALQRRLVTVREIMATLLAEANDAVSGHE